MNDLIIAPAVKLCDEEQRARLDQKLADLLASNYIPQRPSSAAPWKKPATVLGWPGLARKR